MKYNEMDGEEETDNGVKDGWTEGGRWEKTAYET